ncbi:MAG: hypothetical protein DRQ55_13655 [Planctomycetota bacterium]|nr:MAG: hypothetical protein DRQ55_13655 [Planctomycetota bacterium]
MEPALNRSLLLQEYVEAIAASVVAVPDEVTDAFVAELLGARKIVTAGRGRSGMVAAAFCRRLGQMGMAAWGLEDTTVPRLGAGDVLVAATGSGTTPTVLSLMDTARSGDARVLAVTRAPSRIDELGDVTVSLDLPALSGVPRFPLGTLFEASLLAYFDLVVVELVAALGATESELDARHTNLE